MSIMSCQVWSSSSWAGCGERALLGEPDRVTAALAAGGPVVKATLPSSFP
jgi:hypothetical protein